MSRPLTVGVSLFACDRGRSGIGRYLVEVVRQLVARGAGHHWHLWLAGEDLAVFPFLDPAPPEVEVHAVDDRFNRPLWSVAWHLARLPRLLERSGVDVLYLPAGNRRLAPLTAVPTVAVVHDLSAFHVRAKYDPARMLYIRRVLPWMMRRLDRVIAVSGSTATDVVELAGVPADRVTVVGLGFDRQSFRPRDAADCRRRLEAAGLSLPERYLVYVSRLEHPGKNHVGLLRGYARALERTPDLADHLVLAGGRWPGSEAVDREIEALGLGARVHLLGFVADPLLPDLLGAARGLVFPSLFEGFGLPILEAQATGVPVACADISSLPEVAGGAALLFDPADTAAIADAVVRLSGDDDLCADLRARGLANAKRFSWERTADVTLEMLEAAADGR